MNKFIYILFLLFLFSSCKTGADSNRNYDSFNPDKVYKLQLNPTAGSAYHYEITNETEIKVETDDKKIIHLNKTNVGIKYTIDKDSAGNFLLTMLYDTIHLYTRNNDTETELDAANAGFSLNPVEKMLGILKEATIISTINSAGQTMSMRGYEEIGDRIIESLGTEDMAIKNFAQSQWKKTIGDGLIKKNMDQLFKIFPDSAVHLQDTWKLTTKEEGDLSLNVKNIYTLKAINSEIALITSEGKIKSNNTSINAPGISNVTADLQGEQKAQYEMEAKTGMLISCTIQTNAEGTIKMMGREIPVTINASVKMKGKRL